MTREQFQSLMDYIDERCKEIISADLGRDTLHESIRARDARNILAKSLNLPEWS
jgi:hypothetical protein